MKILDLGEKGYVESLFTNGKSHLLRNETDNIIHHQRSNNSLKGFSDWIENSRSRISIP